MMRRTYLLFIFLLLYFSENKAQQSVSHNNFYYYNGEKIYLQTDYSRITVVSEGLFSVPMTKSSNPAFVIENKEKSHIRQQVISVEHKTKSSVQDEYISELRFLKPLTSTEYARTIQNLQEETNVVKILPFFTRSDNKLGISNNIYVKLLKKEDSDKLFELAEKYSMQVLGYNEFMPLWFTLSCRRESTLNSIDAANLFYETGLFESVEPELLYYNLLTSNDQYYPDQWGLKNTGQYNGTVGRDIHAEQAWSITTGASNIKVAVFDQGIEMNHPDLQNNIYGNGYDAETNTVPSVLRGDHGTSCAGIIGAQKDNSVGVSGVAPHAKLISISINLAVSNTPQQLANGFNWAWQQGADVISNSWGGYAPSGIIDNAIINTLSLGRNGKGTVVVFASGNYDDTEILYPGNCNPDVLVVGAMSPCGERKSPTSCDTEDLWGSNYGAELDIVAPGVLIPTTDLQGLSGYNPNSQLHTEESGGTKRYSDYSFRNYTVWFNGTSVATPHVAGVAALILSVDPNLTVQQVNNIIESTAQKVGGYNYQTTSGRPNGTWNNEMGYGLVDAYAAVVAALNINCNTITINNQTYSGENQPIVGCTINITGNTTIKSGANVRFTSTKGVIIAPGFWAKSGSNVIITAAQASQLSASNLRSANAQEEADMITSLEQAVIAQPASNTDFTVYPNPNDGNFTVEIAGEPQPYTVEIFNASGGMMGKVDCDAQAVNINRSDLPTGTYFLKLGMAGKQTVKKLIVK